jgi:hypothetical protein
VNPSYPTVAARAQHRCEYCHAPELIFNFPFEVEHIIPVSFGGENIGSNFALACRSCNLFKGAYIQYPDPDTGKKVRLYDPRQDNWWNHFEVDLETYEIHGISSIGRATVTCLNFNSQSQLKARKKWGRFELFP